MKLERDEIWLRAFFAALPAAVTKEHKTDCGYSDYSICGHRDLRPRRSAEMAWRIADSVAAYFSERGELPPITREAEEELP